MHLTNNIVLSTHRTNTQYDVINIFQIEVLAKVSNDDRMTNITTFLKDCKSGNVDLAHLSFSVLILTF